MAKAGWTVTSQVTDQVILTDAGQPVTGTYIYITTSAGNSASVFVPDNIYPNKKKVTEMLRTKAQLVDDIGALYEKGEDVS